MEIRRLDVEEEVAISYVPKYGKKSGIQYKVECEFKLRVLKDELAMIPLTVPIIIQRDEENHAKQDRRSRAHHDVRVSAALDLAARNNIEDLRESSHHMYPIDFLRK